MIKHRAQSAKRIRQKHCEMCGAPRELIPAIIEGAQMEVCSECVRFGKIIVKPKPEIIERAVIKNQKNQFGAGRPGYAGSCHSHSNYQKKEEIIETINPDFGEIIKNKREKLGIKQKELAKMLAEKESIIQKMENNEFSPSIEIAKKIEKILKIKIIEQEKEEKHELEKSSGEGYTLGDFIKNRMS